MCARVLSRLCGSEYARLVVVGSTLTDLRGQVVRGPHTGAGQLHGATRHRAR